MTSAMKPTFLFAIIALSASVAYAQNAAPTHVFPQVVDGVGSDDTVYTSRFLIASIGGFPATCNLSLFGLGAGRLESSQSLLIPPASWQSVSTLGRDSVASGYARLDCSQPVFASLTYSLQSASGTPLGIATVAAAPIASNAFVPMLLNGRYRYGIALANNNDDPLTALLSFTSSGETVLKPIQVPPRSNYVAFVDEIFSVPTEGSGTFEILANGSTGSDNFNIEALLFDQTVFTSVVPAFVH